MNEEYIIILHYNTGELFYRELTKADNELIDKSIEDFMNHYNLNIDECSWMYTTIEPNLTYLTTD